MISTVYSADSTRLLNSTESNTAHYKNAILDIGRGTAAVDSSGNLVKYFRDGSVSQAWDKSGNKISSSSVAARPASMTPTGGKSDGEIVRELSGKVGIESVDYIYGSSPSDLLKAMTAANYNTGSHGYKAPSPTVMPKKPSITNQSPLNTSSGSYAPSTQQRVNSALGATGGYANPLLNTSQGKLDPRTGTLYGAGNNNISDLDIRTFINQAKSNEDVLAGALKYGVSVDQIARAMGGQGGFTSQGIDSYLATRGISRPSQTSSAAQPAAGTQFQPQLPATIDPYQGYAQGYAGFQNTLQGLLNAPLQAQEISRPTPASFTPVRAPAPVSYSAPTASQTVINPTTGTVEGRLRNLTDPNSLLMQRAMSLGQQNAARSGLLNSSIAGTAEQAALLDAATAIASQDAQAYNQTGLANTQARNTMNLANAQNALQAGQINSANQLQASLANSELSSKTSMFNSDAAMRANMFNSEMNANIGKFNNELYTRAATTSQELGFNYYKTNFDAANQVLLTKMNNDNAVNLETIRNKFNKDLQQSATAAGMYDNYFKMANDVFSRDIPEESKQTILGNLNTMLKDGLTLNSIMMGTQDALNFNKGTSQGGLGGLFNTQVGSTKVDYLNAPPTTMQSATSGAPLGKDPNNPTVVNTIGGFLPINVADALQKVLNVDPRLTVTIPQKDADPNLNRAIETGVRNGSVTRLTLEKLAGVKPGMFGSKKIYEGLDKAFTLLGGHVYYDPANTLGRATNIQAVPQPQPA